MDHIWFAAIILSAAVVLETIVILVMGLFIYRNRSDDLESGDSREDNATSGSGHQSVAFFAREIPIDDLVQAYETPRGEERYSPVLLQQTLPNKRGYGRMRATTILGEGLSLSPEEEFIGLDGRPIRQPSIYDPSRQLIQYPK